MAAPIEMSSGTYDTACVVTGGECLARQNLVELYTGYSDPAAVSDFERQVDHMKLLLKLSENAVAANAINCPGPDETCPVRDAMDNSRTRMTAVSGLRKILGKRGN